MARSRPPDPERIKYDEKLARFCELDLDYALGHLELADKNADDPTLREFHIDAARRIHGQVCWKVARMVVLDGKKEKFRRRLKELAAKIVEMSASR